MSRVVLIEDEKLVLLGIISLFDESTAHQVAGSYTNPKKALDEIPHLLPDIVITDIKMPQMDGLDLIRTLKSTCPEIQIVVLSCHDDFSIVHEAFKLGIADYLLKDEVEKDSLFAVLDSLQDSSLCHHSPEPADEQNSRQGIPVEFSVWLATHASDEPLPENLLLVMFVFKQTYAEDFQPDGTRPDIGWCVHLIRQHVTSLDLGSCYLHNGIDVLCVLRGDEESTSRRKTFFQTISDELNNFINRPVVILKSRTGRKAEIDLLWRELQEMRSAVFYEQANRIIASNSNRTRLSRDHLEFPEPRKLFNPDLYPAWKDGMREVFATARSLRTVPSVVFVDLLVYWHSLQTAARELYQDQEKTLIPELDPDGMYNEIITFDDMEMLGKWILAAAEDIHKRLRSLHAHRRIVVQLKLYLMEHYQEHISLARLSDHVHLHENYLSELFKKETGMGYVDFLNNYRIEKAQQLLLISEETVEAIGQSVGFVSASHFSKIFKRTTGITISEFRKQR